MIKYDAKEIGQIIKQARKAKGLTQGELGKMLNVVDTAVSKYEKGQIANIPLEIRLKLATILDIPRYFLCNDDELKMLKIFLKESSKNEV